MNTASALRLIMIITAACLLVVFASHYIFTATPPSFPSLAASDSEEDISKAISWHLNNTSGTIVNEIDRCLANQTSGDIVCDDQLFYSKANKSRRLRFKTLSKTPSAWPFIWSDSSIKDDEFFFSRYRYQLKSIQKISDKQTVLGKRIIVEAVLERVSPSPILDLLGIENKSENTATDFGEKDVSIYFIHHPYGLSIPIKPLPKTITNNTN